MEKLKGLIKDYIDENAFVTEKFSPEQIKLLQEILIDFCSNYVNCKEKYIGEYSNEEFLAIKKVFDSPLTHTDHKRKLVTLWVDRNFEYYKQEIDGSWTKVDENWLNLNYVNL